MPGTRRGHEPPIEGLVASCFEVPTSSPESDGTFEWTSTTIVVVEARAGGECGLGYTYGHASAGKLVESKLEDAVRGVGAFSVRHAWSKMIGAVRNLGRPGVAATAISAVDNALWDLKGRLLGLSVLDLLGAERPAIPIYGSGGFTSYSIDELQRQLAGWIEDGMWMVKMKVGREPAADPDRVRAVREAIGEGPQIFVDGNGAYTAVQAASIAQRFADQNVTWFEEPVSSDDLDGLRRVRESAPPGMAIAAGEYGWDVFTLLGLLEAGSVDVLQADATRCLGITGFMDAAAMCRAHKFPLSAHCAPTLHAHTTCAAPAAIHLEYFHDHCRIEQMLFDGAPRPNRGMLAPDRSRPGLGLELRRADAEKYRIGP